MKRVIFSLLALISMMAAFANDSEYFTVGNQLVPMQATNISVAKEILTINLLDNGNTGVDVYYEFENSGNAQDVLMGFEAMPPYMENEYNKSGVHPNINGFTVVMNDQKLTYKNALSMADITKGIQPVDTKKWAVGEGGGLVSRTNDTVYANYSYVYYFKAHFKPGKNIIHHTYTYASAYGISHSFWVDYKLTPATRWANHQIDDFTLRITSKNTQKHYAVMIDPFKSGEFKITEGVGKMRSMTFVIGEDTEKYEEFSTRNAVVEWHATNYKPEAELFITSCDRLLEMSTFAKNLKNFNETSYYDCGEHFYPLYSPSKDAKFARRIIKNLPFASRGYVFKDAKLRKYFESQWWYIPDATYVPNSKGLTATDRRCTSGEFKLLVE